MANDWEVRGLFGNEYALERAIDELGKMEKKPWYKKLDRRNLQVLVAKNDAVTQTLVKNIITIAHGFVESDAPLGEFDKRRAEMKAKRAKAEAEKRKRRAKARAAH